MKSLFFFLFFAGTFGAVNAQMAFTNVNVQDTTLEIKNTISKVETTFVVTANSGLIAPTLWKYADGMEGYDMYAVYKSMWDRKLYLIGFDSEGVQNLKVLIEQATFNEKLNQCTVIQNGTEIRLRQREP